MPEKSFMEKMHPIYDINKSYLENAEEGPFFEGKIPEREHVPEKWTYFLGFRVASRIGVPAGPLLNSRWVALAASLGFDIVTYKTIRSQAHPAHPVPNMVYVSGHRFLQPTEEGGVLKVTSAPQSLRELAMTNSFGIPSRDPDYLIEDIEKANRELRAGQVLIVSVVGTPRKGQDYFDDFAEAAFLAVQGGAPIIEADLSCPNIGKKEGSLYTDPTAVFEITARIRKVIGDRPLILKMGMIRDKETFKKVAVEACRAGANAIAGINTLSMQVVDEAGKPALGENRLRAGVCGAPIRLAALDFTRLASEVIKDEKLDLSLLATGGVILPEHFDLFFEMGADVAMSALGMMWDPLLAYKYHERVKNRG